MNTQPEQKDALQQQAIGALLQPDEPSLGGGFYTLF